jgi:porphobilinogen synthase
MVRETLLTPDDFILPLFVRAGKGTRVPISSMPGHAQLSSDLIVKEAQEAKQLGLGGVLLFGIPDSKDATGSSSWADNGPVQTALKMIKQSVPDLLVITDVCFCEYTDHGHCGVLNQKTGRTDVDNDATLELLVKQAVSHAKHGADIIAPSGMMDGMIRALRRGLDQASYEHLPIMSYAIKYASAFYGPFREAAESTPQSGDRRGYQMDPTSSIGQAMREAELDLGEGADMLMVKPALAYLDVLREASQKFPGVPLAAYNVSGEYSMIQAAADKGWLNEKQCALEMLTAIRRAGASIIITYWAKQAAKWIV